MKFVPRMMSTESANSFTLIGEASDGGTMENLSRRLKASGVQGGHLGSLSKFGSSSPTLHEVKFIP